MRVILLAAGVGRRFGRITNALPKCLIPLGRNGRHLLSRYLDSFRTLGLKEIIIVVGHGRQKIIQACHKEGKGLQIRFISNKDYRKGSVLSLYKASGAMNQDCLIMDADVYFPTYALKRLLDSRHKACFLVDRSSKSTGEEMMVMAKNGRPFAISKKLIPGLKILGESVGFLKINGKSASTLRQILKGMIEAGETSVEHEESYDRLMKKIKIGAEPISKVFWTEMDFKKDLDKIRREIEKQTKL